MMSLSLLSSNFIRVMNRGNKRTDATTNPLIICIIS